MSSGGSPCNFVVEELLYDGKGDSLNTFKLLALLMFPRFLAKQEREGQQGEFGFPKQSFASQLRSQKEFRNEMQSYE